MKSSGMYVFFECVGAYFSNGYVFMVWYLVKRKEIFTYLS
jgi:hypothetical protein